MLRRFHSSSTQTQSKLCWCMLDEQNVEWLQCMLHRKLFPITPFQDWSFSKPPLQIQSWNSASCWVHLHKPEHLRQQYPFQLQFHWQNRWLLILEKAGKKSKKKCAVPESSFDSFSSCSIHRWMTVLSTYDDSCSSYCIDSFCYWVEWILKKIYWYLQMDGNKGLVIKKIRNRSNKSKIMQSVLH